MAYIEVVSGSIDLPRRGVLSVDGIAVQNFSSGNVPWGFILTIDGMDVLTTGRRQASQDLVPLKGSKFCEAGPRTVSVRWAGDPAITLAVVDLTLLGFNGTEGS